MFVFCSFLVFPSRFSTVLPRETENSLFTSEYDRNPAKYSLFSVFIHNRVFLCYNVLEKKETTEDDMRLSRQNKILEIIKTHEVETQDQLLNLLRDSGYNVTQATVSRDIRELQLVKGQGKDGKYRYTSGNYENRPISDRFIKIFRETTLSYACAQNLIVVKTLPGCAGAAGEAIDTLSLEHMVGSVCGDNTMLVIVDDEKNVPYITAEFDKVLNSND